MTLQQYSITFYHKMINLSFMCFYSKMPGISYSTLYLGEYKLQCLEGFV